MTSRQTTQNGDPRRTKTRALAGQPLHKKASETPKPPVQIASSSLNAQADDNPPKTPASAIRIFDTAEALRGLRELHGTHYLQSIRLDTQAQHEPDDQHNDRHEHLEGLCVDNTIGRAYAPPSPPSPPSTPSVQWSISEQARAIRDMSDLGVATSAEFELTPNPNLKDEDLLRSRRLHLLLEDAQDGYRKPLIATNDMITAIEGLRVIAPQFGDVIGVVENAAAMSLVTGQPISVPPLLMLGPPGIGKTFFAKRLAAALGSMVVSLSMNLTPSFGLLAGLSTAWRGAGPGKIASTLIDSPNASPVILFDEIEKVITANAHDRPLDVMHSLWEAENAEAFRDEYYDITFNASHIISIATANSTIGIAPSLMDRLLILDIRPPTFEQRRAIARQAYAAAILKTGGHVNSEPADALLDLLAASTPRRITRLIGLALPIAITARRDTLLASDIAAAAALLDSARPKESRRIGFIPIQSLPSDTPL